ncbi:putative leader peptide [Streptomyces liangshanensis]|uniref:Uncharacterized protein n=1 Tax=Streptomyces liangshanensis TaxID=2717324 RepID=A0A6G9GSH4_9ACTN|nr:putative leader peptide [Streptomyces liangshanensis]QIQ01175.1 hypothetical protein HA039_01645 [Streptomyces liangshanensis]
MRGRSGTRTAFAVTSHPRAVGMFSRRHIDLQRVAGALCPGHVNAAPRHTP